MNLCIPYTPWLVHPLWIVTWKVGCPCVTLSVSHSPWLWFHTLFRMCTCISSWIYVDLMPMSGPAAMHSLMETWVPLYGSVFVSQVSHFCSHTLFRMCTCISTCIYVHLMPMSGPAAMHSLMETWVPLYGSVFVSQVSHFCSHTLFRMCTCISIGIYVHLTPHISSTPYV